MKSRIALLLIYFTSILFQESFLVKADLGSNHPYICTGAIKTLVRSYPLEIKLEDERLSWEIDWYDAYWGYGFGMTGDYFAKRENIEFDVKYSDGVLVKRIDDNKLSVRIFSIDGTLFLDRLVRIILD